MISISVDDLLERLRSEGKGNLLPPKTLTVTGFVKLSGDDLQFSPGLSCRFWLTIPESLIGSVQVLGKIPCDDHSHDYVRLELNPLGDSPTANAIAMLEIARALSVELEKLNESTVTAKAPGRDATFGQMANFTEDARLGVVPLRWKPRCAACIAGNIALSAAIAAAVVAMAPVLGLGTPALVTYLMNTFGISAAAAGAASGGLSGTALAAALCGDVC